MPPPIALRDSHAQGNEEELHDSHKNDIGASLAFKFLIAGGIAGASAYLPRAHHLSSRTR